MNITRFEAIGMSVSVALMAAALWLYNLETTTSTMTANLSTAEAVVADTSGDQAAALRDALMSAGAERNAVERLVIDDIALGTGPAVNEGDTVTVHYIGTLTDGTEFDNSYQRGEPFTFTLGKGRVIEGWERGVSGMRVGGQRVIVVPPELGYGASTGGPIPPNSTLVFAIELLQIN